MKKTRSTVFWVVLSVLVLLLNPISLYFFTVPAYNDMLLFLFQMNINRIPLPPDTVFIEYQSECGNLKGTSNQLHALATVLIRSKKSVEELQAFYGIDMNKKIYDRRRGIKEQSSSRLKLDEDDYGCVSIEYKNEQYTSDKGAYYVLYFFDEVSPYFYWLDCRSG